MSWGYSFTGTDGSTEMTMEVFDHNGEHVTSVTNDGTGITVPDEVEEVMVKDAQGARSAGDMARWREIHIRLAAGMIEEREG